MAAIWNYPDLPELENFIARLALQAADNISEQRRPEATLVSSLALDRILIVDKWGNGTAEFGDDPLHVALFFDFAGPDQQFETTAGAVTSEMINIIEEGDFPIPEDLLESTSNITFTPANSDLFNDVLVDLTNAGMDLVYDLTNSEGIDLKVGTPPDQYPRIPLSELRSVEEEEVEEEADVEEEEEDEDVEEATGLEEVEADLPDLPIITPLPEDMLPDIEEEDIGPEFPEINENLRPFAISSDTLEIPAGKEEKQIEAREPYDFEVEMALPGLQTDASTLQATREEIAVEAGRGAIGDNEPVGTYPRTGIYIRNYLTFRGPAYSYEIYKNLVFYSGYISTLHDINVRAGSYRSFREYMYVLKRIGEEGGPQLVEELSQQAAAARGLESIPDHPSIPGTKAPWLENRQYYEIISENDDSDAWNNAYEFLHGDEGNG